MLPEIGEEGQRRLHGASVLIVGLGGLGCPVSMYLAGAGVGRLGLVDPDVVSLSNLHRQLLYADDQIDELKVEAASRRLPCKNIELYAREFSGEFAEGYDLIMDCTDNFLTRYQIDSLGKRWVHGSVSGFEGRVAVFDASHRYADLFPDCEGKAAEGIIGPTAGVIGSIQASEAIKLICGIRPNLLGRLLTMNLLTLEFEVFDI